MSDRGTAAVAIDDSAPGVTGLTVDVDIRDGAWRDAVDDPEWTSERAALAAFDRAAGISGPAEVSIVLGDDAFVADLNARYRGKDAPTNVLSFPGDREPAGDMSVWLGDIAIARETVVREARAEDKSVGDHLAHMVVHGMLHLLGHDHEADDEAATMETLEVSILGGLGIADPYRGDGD